MITLINYRCNGYSVAILGKFCFTFGSCKYSYFILFFTFFLVCVMVSLYFVIYLFWIYTLLGLEVTRIFSVHVIITNSVSVPAGWWLSLWLTCGVSCGFCWCYYWRSCGVSFWKNSKFKKHIVFGIVLNINKIWNLG